MSQKNKSQAIVVVSIDVNFNRHATDTTGIRELSSVCQRIVRVLDKHNTPATWAVTDPSCTAISAVMMSSRTAHELALLGDGSWIGPDAGRTGFARHLLGHLEEASSIGLQISTLAVEGADLRQNLDLLAKYHISMVRPDAAGRRRSIQGTIPRKLRYGLWQLPAAARKFSLALSHQSPGAATSDPTSDQSRAHDPFDHRQQEVAVYVRRSPVRSGTTVG